MTRSLIIYIHMSLTCRYATEYDTQVPLTSKNTKNKGVRSFKFPFIPSSLYPLSHFFNATLHLICPSPQTSLHLPIQQLP